jgi:transketolase
MPKASRVSFGESMVSLGASHPNLVVLDADLGKSTQTTKFMEAFPERHFQFGIAEANMLGTASGLALAGYNPFIASFATFITGRFDQIKMSVAYSRAPVRIVGSHCGIGIGEDGYSQQALEDIALMRSLPEMLVLQPADHIEAQQVFNYLVEHTDSPAYIRVTRQKLDDVHDDSYQFQLGKADVLIDGTHVAIFATGGTVGPAVEAAQVLEKEGIDAMVVNFHTIKPIDADFIKTVSQNIGCIVTVEDHNIMGGFGSAVAESLVESHPCPMKRMGIPDVFGESGTPKQLYDKYHFNGPGIASFTSDFLKSI